MPGRYTLIPRTLIFLTKNDEVLLLKGAPTKRLWANRFNGIGGHIEQGEDVLTAARRELLEESGLQGVSLRICGVITVDAGQDTGIGIYVLRGKLDSNAPLQHSGEGKLHWVPIDRLSELSLVEDLPTILPRVLSMQPGDPPFSASYSYNSNDQLVISFGS